MWILQNVPTIMVELTLPLLAFFDRKGIPACLQRTLSLYLVRKRCGSVTTDPKMLWLGAGAPKWPFLTWQGTPGFLPSTPGCATPALAHKKAPH